VGPVAVDLADSDRFTDTTRAIARLGFFGRACIHPAQVPTANAVFTPTPEQLRWAEHVAAGATGGGVWRDAAGNMVDEAVLRRAQRFIAVQAALTTR
jgi:citrate lyase subunit beta/citryl-CoA lyase